MELQQGGSMLRDAHAEATKRNNEFIRQQQLAPERKEYGTLKQKKTDLQSLGEKLSDKDQQRLTDLYITLLPHSEETFTNAKADYERAKEEIDTTAKEVAKGVGFSSPFDIKRAARATQWLGDGAMIT